ncbi:TCP-1/cpn60 chaperonin family protein [Natronomonas sp.]|uniref:TCP-1/cpn60 chaperonin family protein n=1 Tax=Natronomonas sp. TaxID=2184060 RepID=UPI0026020D5B|nr:TCP-1/cpn60 chaperonin family protein [Natronomonas sp.]
MSLQGGDDVGDDISFPEANVVAVRQLAGALATTYGPVSMDKLVVTEVSTAEKPDPKQVAIDDYIVSNDGGTILEKMPLEHPIAPLVEGLIGPERPGRTDVEGQDIPDGVVGTTLLTAALLDEAVTLIERGLHPTDVVSGYDEALSIALETLTDATRQLPDDADRDREPETAIARTAMTGNDVGGNRDAWARLAVEAVDQVGMPNQYSLAVRRIKHGSLDDSRLVYGTILDRNEIARDHMPTAIDDASVLVLGGYERDTASDGRSGGLRDPQLGVDATLDVESPADIEAFDELYGSRRDEIVASIVEADIDVVATRLGISNEFLELLSERGIAGIRGVNRLKLRQLARATGATIVNDSGDIRAEHAGTAGRVEQRRIQRRQHRRKHRNIVVFEDCPDPDSVTVHLSGSVGEIGEEASRQLRKAAAAVAIARGEADRRAGFVPGGGAIDAAIAREVRDAAPSFDSRSQLAVEAFADAAETIVHALAKNAGADPLGVTADVRAGAETWGDAAGFVLPAGAVGDALEAGVLDPTDRRRTSYQKAVQVASLVLRIDDALDAEFSEDPVDPEESIYPDRKKKQMEMAEET